ncbi:MAG TPA: cytidylate kinase family protein [Candidatus Caccomorpha excrementavium]|nr:cytidylate kinase family protein [Candidatus Caccomorpha excrementavium]
MHITLTGNLGSGKSTICKILKGSYGYEIFSTGTIQRKIADDMGLTTLELNQLMCTDKKYDNLIDDTTMRIAKENPDKSLIFDSRLAWHFVEESFKVFLSVSLEVAAERVFHDNRGSVESYQSQEDAMEQLRRRAQTEDRRYQELYGLDYFNFNNYNLILDSTYSAPELLTQVMLEEEKAYEALAAKERAAGKPKILVSPKRLGIGELTKEDRAELVGLLSEAAPSGKYPKAVVGIRRDGQTFRLVKGEDIVKLAVRDGLPFVQCEIV